MTSYLDTGATRAPPLAATLGGLGLAREGADLEIDFRLAAVRAGFWLGWIAIAVVIGGLALDLGARHRLLLIGLTLAAAGANTAGMLVPWREWLPTRRGQGLLDLLSGGLIGFVVLLVAAGGVNFALLLFLTIPFIAVVQTGWRRAFWLAAGAGTCALASTLLSLPAGATAMRMSLVAAATGVAVMLARAIRREAAAHRQAAARADLERTLATEANHRITNNLQSVSDLLLLGHVDGGDRRLDEAAARIRSIAIVHRLLTKSAGVIEADALLRRISATAPVPVAVEADPVALDAGTAQKLGIVANELITNAAQHGAGPILVRLSAGDRIHLVVDNAGDAVGRGSSGLGLELVRRMVEQGLGGRFELTGRPGHTRAEVVFPGDPA